jgi:lysophospholipase L1-like esterase
MHTIFWASDSTVQTNNYSTYPATGIGQAFHLFLQEGYTVENHSKNGRSTKSFIDEGRLEPIKEKIQAGDFLFIQFGHNDEKVDDPARYTQPFGTFLENLKIFIQTATDKGAYPLLITPLERRCFDANGQLLPGDHQDYVAAMKHLSLEAKVPLVDLHAASRDLLAETGDEGSLNWYMNFPAKIYAHYWDGSNDNTHLRYEGAVAFGALIAEGIKALDSPYKDMVLADM